MTQRPPVGLVLALWFVLTALWPATVSARQPTTASPQELSPEVARVMATYEELGEELWVVMATGEWTERSKMLEARLPQEVRDAVPGLLELVRHGDRELANVAAKALGYAPEADPAVAVLLQALRRFDGALVNNIGLALEHLILAHPTVEVPVTPLVEVLGIPESGPQQKIAQVLRALVERGPVPDPDGSLAAALIPLLASQRDRVYGPAREVLPHITAQNLGDEPEVWADFYRERFGRPVDVAGGIYELVEIIRPRVVDELPIYRIEDHSYRTHAEVLEHLSVDKKITLDVGRRFSVVIQLPTEGFPAAQLDLLAEAIQRDITPWDLTAAPVLDDFVPFSVAVENLRRFLALNPTSRTGRSGRDHP